MGLREACCMNADSPPKVRTVLLLTESHGLLFFANPLQADRGQHTPLLPSERSAHQAHAARSPNGQVQIDEKGGERLRDHAQS